MSFKPLQNLLPRPPFHPSYRACTTFPWPFVFKLWVSTPCMYFKFFLEPQCLILFTIVLHDWYRNCKVHGRWSILDAHYERPNFTRLANKASL